MKKNTLVLICVIVVVVLAVGGYLIFHKSSTPTPAASTQGSSSSNQSTGTTNNAVLVTKTDATVGEYLADPSGKPLYTYGGDTAGVSNCTGSCLANWPAYQATSTTNLPAGVGTIKRTDNGQTQYTYNGLPLYYFVADSPGKVTGNGLDNFTVAKPAAASSSSSTPSSTGSSTASGSNASSSSSPNYPY